MKETCVHVCSYVGVNAASSRCLLLYLGLHYHILELESHIMKVRLKCALWGYSHPNWWNAFRITALKYAKPWLSGLKAALWKTVGHSFIISCEITQVKGVEFILHLYLEADGINQEHVIKGDFSANEDCFLMIFHNHNIIKV